MSAACNDHCASANAEGSAAATHPGYRRVLWVALVANVLMFVVELGAGLSAGSLSLLADSIDFAGDAANYGLSLAVLGMSLQARAKASLVKAASMAAFGVFILVQAAWLAWRGQPPEPLTMGVVGLLALATNVSVALMLYRWRSGDSNMRSVWLCSRNDALGNVAVLVAAGAVAFTGQAWPDLLVAAFMATLALWSAMAVARQARGELVAQHAHREVA